MMERTKVLSMVAVLALLMGSGVIHANLIVNPHFSLDADGNVDMTARSLDNTLGWYGSGWSNVVVPTEQGAPLPPNGLDIAGRISFTHWDHDLRQNTGHSILDDTVYTLTFDTYALTWTWQIAVEWFADGEYLGWSRIAQNLDNSGNWRSHTMERHLSAEWDDVVGKELGLRFMIVSEDQGGGRVLLSNVQLIPEPTTLALLGFGGLAVLKSRKRG